MMKQVKVKDLETKKEFECSEASYLESFLPTKDRKGQPRYELLTPVEDLSEKAQSRLASNEGGELKKKADAASADNGGGESEGASEEGSNTGSEGSSSNETEEN